MPKTVNIATTDADIEAAMARGNVFAQSGPRAAHVEYRAGEDRIALRLSNGVEVLIPRLLLQGLEGAAPEALALVEIVGPGSGLHWPVLDVDHYVPSLLRGVFGTAAWMREIGAKGGAVKSPAKARAAKANGHKGGRPRRRVSAGQG